MEAQMFAYKIQENACIIEKYTGEETRVEVPDEIDGCKVTELAAYAFSGTSVAEVYLPKSVWRIGRYVFYNCFSLKTLGFYSSLQDIGAGAFTGCSRIHLLQLKMTGEGISCLKEILQELPQALCVEVHGRKEARLMFPEFYEEGVENTPARILETHTHGSGMHYRNCFLQKMLNIREYDSRFPLAKSRESVEFLVELVFGRLQYPVELSEAAKTQYIKYIEEHQEEITRLLTGNKDMEKLSYLMELGRGFRKKKSSSKFEL